MIHDLWKANRSIHWALWSWDIPKVGAKQFGGRTKTRLDRGRLRRSYRRLFHHAVEDVGCFSKHFSIEPEFQVLL